MSAYIAILCPYNFKYNCKTKKQYDSLQGVPFVLIRQHSVLGLNKIL